MPRNSAGTYTLPAGNPVVAGTTIDASWANDTMSDMANELTNSLSRTGAGGMLAPFRVADGSVTAPGLGFTNETNTGLYRAGTGELWFTVGGVAVAQITANGLLIPSGKRISLPAPVNDADAANKEYVDDLVNPVIQYANYYLGPKSSDPSVNNSGGALTAGTTYWSTTLNQLRVYNGTTWEPMPSTASLQGQTFSGTGAQTVYTLAAPTGNATNLEVFISGVRQVPTTDYTVSGTTLTFTSAPPSGTNNIYVRFAQLIAMASADSSNISYLPAGTGAVTRTAQSKMRDVVSVKDFGAVGDGVTNDTAAVQAAINYAQTIKAWVYFPPVEFAYMVSGVTIGQAGTNYTCHFIGGGFDPSGASQPITGQYTGQSEIKLIAGSNTSLITVHEDAAQPQFKNITFNGNGSEQSGTSYCINMADTTLPSGRYRYACWMEDCFVSSGRTGGIFIGSNRGAGIYRNVWVQYCGTTSTDIAVNVRCFDQQFQNIQVGPNNGTGMYIGAATQIQVEGSVFFMNKVHLQIDQGAATVQFTDCVFDEAGEDGVIVTRGAGAGAYGARIFTNCAFQRNSKDANDTYSDIVVNGDRRLVLDSCSFVGDFGQGWLPKYNIECDNTLQSTHIRLSTPVLESNSGATAATAFTNQWFSLAYAGDRTAYISPWAGANQLSVVLNDVEEVRFTPNAMSLVGAAYCDPRYVTPAPTTGSTVTMTANQTNCALLPAGSLAALTVALPPPQGDGQIVRISSSQAITSLTVTPQAPATFVFNSGATLAAGESIAFIYVAGGTAWARI